MLLKREQLSPLASVSDSIFGAAITKTSRLFSSLATNNTGQKQEFILCIFIYHGQMKAQAAPCLSLSQGIGQQQTALHVESKVYSQPI